MSTKAKVALALGVGLMLSGLVFWFLPKGIWWFWIMIICWAELPVLFGLLNRPLGTFRAPTSSKM